MNSLRFMAMEDKIVQQHQKIMEMNDEIVNLKQENMRLQKKIDKVIDYIEENKEHEYRNGNLDEYYLELNEKEMTKLLDILKEVK